MCSPLGFSATDLYDLVVYATSFLVVISWFYVAKNLEFALNLEFLSS